MIRTVTISDELYRAPICLRYVMEHGGDWTLARFEAVARFYCPKRLKFMIRYERIW